MLDISYQLLDISHQSSHQLLDNYSQENKTQCQYRLKNNILKTSKKKCDKVMESISTLEIKMMTNHKELMNKI